MERLTSNKNVLEMNPSELALNCVYVKDDWCRYRDYETDIDLVDLAVKLSEQLGGHIVTADGNGEKEDISEELWDNLQYGFSTIDGLVAFIYTRLVALGQMQDILKAYEDLVEQGKLPKLPCAVGDTVYTNHSVQGWYFRKENRPYVARVVFIGFNGTDNYINVDFGDGHMLQFKFSDIGKTVFLTKSKAEEALQKMNEMEVKE